MATKGQTHAKRARELELKERRERKRAKKAERAAGETTMDDAGSTAPDAEERQETPAEWIQ